MNAKVLLRILFIIGAGLAAAAATLFCPPEYLPYGYILAILSVLAVFILRRFARLLYCLMLFSAVVCLGSQFDSLGISGTTVSISGLGWGFAAGIILGILAARLSEVRIPKFSVPFFALVAWTAVRWLSSSLTLTGLKDILFYGLPPLAAVFSLLVLSLTGSGIMRKIENLLLAAVLLPVGLYLVLIPAGMTSFSRNGPVGAIEARGVALFLLIVLSVALARWNYGATRRERIVAAGCGLLAAGTIFFTLSRMAGITALLLLALGLLKPRRLRDVAFGAAVAGVAAAAVVFGIPLLHDRFFSQSSSDLWSVLLSLRTSGRNVFWAVTFEHVKSNPVIGWGPGSARILIAQALPRRNVTEYFPHNEYLQVFHDLGIVGLALLLAGYIPLFFRLWRQWRDRHTEGNRAAAARNMAALLAITAVLVTSITANTLHYAFVTVPAFLLVGFAHYQNREAGKPTAETAPPRSADESV